MTVRVEHGDCLDVLPRLAAEGVLVDACVCDPPYHLTSIVKRFGAVGAAPAQHGSDGRYARASAGFMGKRWDGGDVAFRPETWALVAAVMKPGAHLLAFGGSRTWHRLAVAIEDAGFEIRDTVAWLYGSGFPKSHNAGGGWGTALKPAMELIVVARKPLIGTVAANMAAHGTGAINIDGCRVEAESTVRTIRRGGRNTDNWRMGAGDTVTGSDLGRWPANVIHDGSDEATAGFPGAHGGGFPKAIDGNTPIPFRSSETRECRINMGDAGSAARFFYAAKADADDRCDSRHPTVKPVSLIRYLARLVTPPGGTILDPFAGSGTLGVAALREGFNAILIEREAEYVADIRRRLNRIAGLDSPLFARAAE